MERNMYKAIKEGRAIVAKHEGLDLSIPEIYELTQEIEGHADRGCSAIMKAYYFGLAVGSRNGRR